MEKSLKEQAIRLFLRNVARHVPLSHARVATLGGRGLEARLWQELGIPSEHGWLIERSRARGNALIRQYHYRSHNQLATLPAILAGGTAKAAIDGLHLDLCGTFSGQSVSDFAPVLPLVLASRGKCLAITVADARRNRVLETWLSYRRRAGKLFGSREARSAFAKLVEQQQRLPVRTDLPSFMRTFDPEKAAKREFGMLVELAELLVAAGMPGDVTIERYAYVSQYGRSSFRMRTYQIHFGESRGSVMQFARAWVNSKLFFGGKNAFEEITTAKLPTPTKAQEGVPPMTKKTANGAGSRLGMLAEAVGGDVLAEFKQLMIDRERLQAILSAVNGAAIPAATPQAHHGRAGESGRGAKRWEDFTPRDQLDLIAKALEAKAGSNGHWNNGHFRDFVTENFGRYTKSLGRTLRSVLARTSGKFQPLFRKRAIKILGEAEAKVYFDRLAKL